MKKFIIYLLKPFSFLPALATMYLIFSFSGQTGVESGNLSHEISYKIVSVADRIFDKNLSEGDKNAYAIKLNSLFKAGSHDRIFYSCYLISFPLYVYGVRGFALFLLAGILCVGFACTDEFHQSFVAGRGPSKRDVFIDSIGALFGNLF